MFFYVSVETMRYEWRYIWKSPFYKIGKQRDHSHIQLNTVSCCNLKWDCTSLSTALWCFAWLAERYVLNHCKWKENKEECCYKRWRLHLNKWWWLFWLRYWHYSFQSQKDINQLWERDFTAVEWVFWKMKASIPTRGSQKWGSYLK